MGYGNKIFQAACQELEQRKRRAEEKAEQGRARFYHQCPRAREIREEMGPPGLCFPAGTCAPKSPN